MKTYLKLVVVVGVIASALTAVSAGAATEPAVNLGVSGRANANVSVATAGSFVGVAWAARTPGGVTDIYTATSRDGGRSFTAPVRVNGVRGDAQSLDSGRSFGPAEPVPGGDATGNRGWEATTVTAKGDVLAVWLDHRDVPVPARGAWDEQLKGARRVVVARGAADDKGAVRFRREAVSDEAGTYPAIAPSGDGAIVAWTSGTTGNTILRVRSLSPTR